MPRVLTGNVSMPKSHKLAVYGTLKSNQRNHFFLEDSIFIGKGTVTGTMVVPKRWGYPVFWPDGDSKIVVEVYEVDDVDMQQISRLEIGAGYHAEMIEVTLDDQTPISAQIWVYNQKIIGDSCVDF